MPMIATTIISSMKGRNQVGHDASGTPEGWEDTASGCERRAITSATDFREMRQPGWPQTVAVRSARPYRLGRDDANRPSVKSLWFQRKTGPQAPLFNARHSMPCQACHAPPPRRITCPAVNARMQWLLASLPTSLITASVSPGDVRDVHFHAAGQLRQLVAERGRAQVAADVGELALLVAEGRLDDEGAPPSLMAQADPQRRVGAVSVIDPPARLAAVDREARRPAVYDAVILPIRLPATSIWLPTAKGTNCSTGCSALGRRVKSGQITPLKMCSRSLIAAISGNACTLIGPRPAYATRAHHAVGQRADGQHVVEMRADEGCARCAPAPPQAKIARRRCRRRSTTSSSAGRTWSCCRPAMAPEQYRDLDDHLLSKVGAVPVGRLGCSGQRLDALGELMTVSHSTVQILGFIGQVQ